MELNCDPKGLVNQLEEAKKTLSRLEYYLMAMAVENAIKLVRELEAIKKQRPAETAYAMPGASGFTIAVFWSEKVPAGSPVYAKPVYQHSFTVDGHTFYADSEVDILYLERKFGVGGKAKLNLVEDK